MTFGFHFFYPSFFPLQRLKLLKFVEKKKLRNGMRVHRTHAHAHSHYIKCGCIHVCTSISVCEIYMRTCVRTHVLIHLLHQAQSSTAITAIAIKCKLATPHANKTQNKNELLHMLVVRGLKEILRAFKFAVRALYPQHLPEASRFSSNVARNKRSSFQLPRGRKAAPSR